MAELPPLAYRIELAEAFVEVVWEKRKRIPPGRGFDTQKSADVQRAEAMESIDWMLDKLILMYVERDGIVIPDHAGDVA